MVPKMLIWASLFAGAAAIAPFREAVLCEARRRILSMFPHKELLEDPVGRDGVSLQISKQTWPCGGGDIPITFLTLDIPNATPEDMMNAMLHTESQAKWDSSQVDTANVIGDFPSLQAQGIAVSYRAPFPFASRELFEWQLVDVSDPDDMWAVWTTDSNENLKSKRQANGGAQVSEDCLRAFRVQRKADGSVRGTFTSQFNGHPFLVSASFVFRISWTKIVDDLIHLRERTQKLAAARGSTPPKLDIPAWMYTYEQGSQADPDVPVPFPACLSKDNTALIDSFEVPNGMTSSFMKPSSMWMLPGLATCLALFMVVKIGRFVKKFVLPVPAATSAEEGLQENMLLME